MSSTHGNISSSKIICFLSMLQTMRSWCCAVTTTGNTNLESKSAATIYDPHHLLSSTLQTAGTNTLPLWPSLWKLAFFLVIVLGNFLSFIFAVFSPKYFINTRSAGYVAKCSVLSIPVCMQIKYVLMFHTLHTHIYCPLIFSISLD